MLHNLMINIQKIIKKPVDRNQCVQTVPVCWLNRDIKWYTFDGVIEEIPKIVRDAGAQPERATAFD